VKSPNPLKEAIVDFLAALRATAKDAESNKRERLIMSVAQGIDHLLSVLRTDPDLLEQNSRLMKQRQSVRDALEDAKLFLQANPNWDPRARVRTLAKVQSAIDLISGE
jgi:hypothetical protein